MGVTRNGAEFWNDKVWASIDDAVSRSADAIRVAQNVFQAVLLPEAASVLDGRFDSDVISIDEGITRQLLEVAASRGVTLCPTSQIRIVRSQSVRI